MINTPIRLRCLQGRIPAFAAFLLRRFHEVNIPLVSSSLTFTTLLALVPLFTITIVVIDAFPMFANIANQFNEFITAVIIPADGGESVRQYLFQFRDKASSLTAIGISMMMITSLLLIQTIERTFNKIWRVRRPRPLLTRILVYWALLTLGPLALGFSLSMWGVALGRSTANLSYPVLLAISKTASSVCFIAILLFLLYKIVPHRYVPPRHALIGAAFTAVLLELTRRGFGFYIANFNNYQLIYGAFAAIPVFLLWLNLLWMILLTGAVLTASLSYWQDDAYRYVSSRDGRFDDVVTILLLLQQAQNQAKTLNIKDLRRNIRMGYDELGDLLNRLEHHDFIAAIGHGWMLKSNAQHIMLSDLFHLFVYRPSAQANNAVSRTIQSIIAPGEQAIDISLADFIARLNHEANAATPPQ